MLVVDAHHWHPSVLSPLGRIQEARAKAAKDYKQVGVLNGMADCDERPVWMMRVRTLISPRVRRATVTTRLASNIVISPGTYIPELRISPSLEANNGEYAL